MLRRTLVFLIGTLIIATLLGVTPTASQRVSAEETRAISRREDRSPVDLVLTQDQKWLVTANQTSHSISLIDVSAGKVVDELAWDTHPSKVALLGDGRHFVVTSSHRGTVAKIAIKNSRLRIVKSVEVGSQPIGVAPLPGTQRVFVGLVATGEVAEVDLEKGLVARRFAVGKWPRYLAVSPNGKRLAIGLSGESKIAVHDVASGKQLYYEPLVGGINLGHMQCSKDGKYVYFPWMVYRSNPITQFNIRKGWVLASRIGRVRLDGSSYREAISLDVPGKAIADPHGLAFSPDEKRLVVTASGTHELLVYRNSDLPYVASGGPGDLIDRKLLRDRDLFYRIELGGRPMGVTMAADNRTAFVVNHLRNSIQVVDIEDRQVISEIVLGPLPSEKSLARRGMEIFHDGRRSLDQWYSCHSCHYDGGVNSRAMDTMNDGSRLTMKTVLPLQYVTKTKPWTWHGWQTDLDDAMRKSFTITMLGRPVDSDDRKAVLAYLDTLTLPPNPFRKPNGAMTASAIRGKAVFESKAAGCSTCHTGRFYTDGKIHDVGLGEEEDRYDGFNTPSLSGLYRKVRFLHDGRSKSLEGLLTDEHAPEKVAGERALTKSELRDIIQFLKSL